MIGGIILNDSKCIFSLKSIPQMSLNVRIFKTLAEIHINSYDTYVINKAYELLKFLALEDNCLLVNLNDVKYTNILENIQYRRELHNILSSIVRSSVNEEFYFIEDDGPTETRNINVIEIDVWISEINELIKSLNIDC
jgi:hypothetical protein